MVQELTPTSMWTFGRGEERLTVRCPDRVRIVISRGHEVVRQIDFHYPQDRVAYQSALESHLLHDGWSLLSFATSNPARI